MAAVAIARRIPSVRVVRLDTGEIDEVDDAIGTTRPSIRTFHAEVGIDDAEIVARTGSGYCAGTQVSGWTGAGYFRGHGGYGNAVGGVPFHLLWIRAQRCGDVAPFDSFAGSESGLQLNLPKYSQALRALGRVAGVEEIHGAFPVVEASAEESEIRTLRLSDGRELSAELYVDATGRAATIRRQLPYRWIDWRGALPVDRLLIREQTVPSSDDRLIALPAGWRYHGVSGVASAHRSDTPDGSTIAFEQGRLENAWHGNCVAIGSAALTLEPTAATNLHAVCRHIERLIACWPGRECHATPAEIAYFNRRTALESDCLRDFVQLPYLLNDRTESFWRAAAAGPVSPELQRTLALFRERGRLPTRDEDGFARDEWIATLIGQGVLPRRTDALADEIPLDVIRRLTGANHES